MNVEEKMYKYRMGITGMLVRTAKKVLVIIVAHKLNRSQWDETLTEVL